MADVPAIRITAIDDASKVIGQIGASLGGLITSVAGVGAAMQTFKQALDFGDQLQTMSEKLGSSVQSLQELSAIAVQSGTNLEAFGKSFKFLAESMIKAQDSASQQGKLFQALGVSIKDAQGNLRAVGDVTADVADALNKVGNETTRTAAGIAIFGKGYLEVAAALRTYRQAQEEANRIIGEFGTVSSVAAQQADQLGDKVKLIGEGFKASTLNEMSRGFASLSASIDGSTSAIAKLSQAIGRSFALDMRDFTVILSRGEQAVELFGTMATAIWESISTKSRAPLAQMNKDLEAIVQKYEAVRGAIRSSFAFPGLGNEDQVSRAAGASDRVKQAQIDSKAVADALSSGSIDKTTTALEGMIKAQDAALASAMKLTEVDKLYIALADMKLGTLKGENLELVKRLTATAQQIDAAKASAEALKLETQALEENNKAWVAKAEEVFKQADAENMQVVAATDLVAQMEEENRLMTLSDQEREREIALRKLQATGIDQTSEAYKNLVTRMDAAVAQGGSMRAQIDLWGQIDRAAHDAFTHIYEGGKKTFDRLLDSIKQIALELAYMAAKKWVLNIAASGSFGSISSLAQAAGGVSGGGFGSIGNLFGLGSAAASSAGYFGATGASIGASEAVGISGASVGSGLGALGAEGGLMAGAMAAVPYIAIAVVAAMAIKGFLDSKKGGPKTGGFSTSGDIGTLSGYTDSSGRFATPNDADSKVKAFTDATLKSYNDFAKALGMKSLAGFAQGFSSDPQGKAGDILHTQAFINGKTVYDVALGDLGRDTQATADRIALENKRALIAALKASDLPGILSKLFTNIVPETITGAAADSLLTFAVAYKDLYDVFNANPMDDALTAIADAAAGAQRAVEKQGEALLDLLDVYDGTGDATTALSTATKSYYASVVQLIAYIKNLKTAIDDMFAASIKQYTFAKLDKGGQYQFLQADVSSAYAKLQASTSATEIDRLTKQIDQDMRDMFGLLSPQEQSSQADLFIKNANAINDTAQAQLAKAEKDANDKMDKILTAIKDAIDAAANNLSGSADDLSAAADDLSSASGTRQASTVTG